MPGLSGQARKVLVDLNELSGGRVRGTRYSFLGGCCDTALGADVKPSEELCPSETAEESRHGGAIMGRRRRFIIGESSQVRSGLIITGMALILVVLLNLSLHVTRVRASAQVAAVSPQLAPILDPHNRLEFLLGLGPTRSIRNPNFGLP